MGERIEWEEIERRKHQIARVTRGGLASTAEDRELEYIAALEAGEAMADAIEHSADCTNGPHDRCSCGACLQERDGALAAWRRCVAPRGEG